MSELKLIRLTPENYQENVCCSALWLGPQLFPALETLGLKMYRYGSSIYLYSTDDVQPDTEADASFANTYAALYAATSCLMMVASGKIGVTSRVEQPSRNGEAAKLDERATGEDDEAQEVDKTDSSEYDTYLTKFLGKIPEFAKYGIRLSIDEETRLARYSNLRVRRPKLILYEINKAGYKKATTSLSTLRSLIKRGKVAQPKPLAPDEIVKIYREPLDSRTDDLEYRIFLGKFREIVPAVEAHQCKLVIGTDARLAYYTFVSDKRPRTTAYEINKKGWRKFSQSFWFARKRLANDEITTPAS